MVEHKCNKCNYLAPDKAALVQHLQRKTPCDEGKYLCRNCAKPMKSKETLRNHQKTCKGLRKTREELQGQHRFANPNKHVSRCKQPTNGSC